VIESAAQQSTPKRPPHQSRRAYSRPSSFFAHRSALEEGDDGRLDRGGIAVTQRRDRHDHVALVIEGDRQQGLAGFAVGHPIAPCQAIHPADLHWPARPGGLGVRAHEFGVGDPLEFGVIGDAGRAIAEPDLRPDIDVDLDAAIRRQTSESFADTPLVEQERPFDLGPDRLDGAGVGRRTHAEHRHGARHQARSGERNRECERLSHRCLRCSKPAGPFRPRQS